DAIALMLDNNARDFEICVAAQRAGLLYTAMSTRLSASEAEYIIADCNAKPFIVSASLSAEANGLLWRTPKLPRGAPRGGSVHGSGRGEELTSAYPETPIPDESAGRDMLYSSGTTGRPKGVKTELVDEAIDGESTLTRTTRTLYGFAPGIRYLSPAPLYHA